MSKSKEDENSKICAGSSKQFTVALKKKKKRREKKKIILILKKKKKKKGNMNTRDFRGEVALGDPGSHVKSLFSIRQWRITECLQAVER